MDLALNQTFTDDDCIDEWHEGQPCFHFEPSVRLPRTDLPVLLDKMRRHNELIGAGHE
jgi:hypothetical protein